MRVGFLFSQFSSCQLSGFAGFFFNHLKDIVVLSSNLNRYFYFIAVL